MNIRDLEQAFRRNDWDVSITSSEHPYERKHRVLQQSIICYALIIACFLMAVVLLYVTYHLQ